MSDGTAGVGQPGTPGTGSGAGGGTATLDWTSSIPQDLQGVPMFQQFQGKELGAVLRHAHELSQEVGRRVPADKAFQIPSDPKAPEWDALYEKVRPQSPDAYQFQAPKELGWDDATTQGIKQMFWEAKVSETQASRLIDGLAAGLQKEKEAEAAALSQQRLADEQALRSKFGTEYDIRMEQATRVAKEFGALEFLTSLGLEKHPILTPMLAALGQVMGEGRLHTGATGILGGASGGDSVETIQGKINMLRASDRWKQGSAEAQKELEALTAQRLEAERRAGGGKGY